MKITSGKLLGIFKRKITVDLGFIYERKQSNISMNITERLKKLSLKNKVGILCFSIDNLDLEKEVVNGTFINEDSIKECTLQIPPIIYNLVTHTKQTSIKTMKQLRTMDNVKVINPINRFNQAIIYEIVSSLSKSENFLLPFEKLNPADVIDLLQNFNSLFIIPEKDSPRCKGILVEKISDNKANNYIISAEGSKSCLQENDVPLNLRKITKDKKCIVLKGNKVLQWKGSPLETRVFIQKGSTGKWDVTALIAKKNIFSNNDIADGLTNILLDIVPDKVDDIEWKLTKYSVNVCTYLSHYIYNLGSCTLDYIIDEDGNTYLIHFGGWEQENSLYDLEYKTLWEKYLSNAFNYALYLNNETIKR